MDKIKKRKGKRTIPEVSKETLCFQSYIEGMSPGMVLSWDRIANDTGLEMNEANKAHFRTGMKRANREYSGIFGYGVKLAGSEDVMPILTNRLIKIDRTVRRGEKSQKLLQEQFFQSLSEKEQKNVLFIGACFGAIRVAAENGSLIFRREVPKQISSSIHIPYQDDGV